MCSINFEEEEFTYTWKIENFCMCPQKANMSLQSPSFTVGVLSKTDWHLNIYPRGKKDTFIVCDVVRESDSGPDNVLLDVQLSLLMTKRMPRCGLKLENLKYTRGQSSSHKLIKREDLLQKKLFFLPKDTLTIQCKLSEKNIGSLVNPITPAVKALARCLYNVETHSEICQFPDEVYTRTGKNVMQLKRTLYPYMNECTALTRIRLEHRSFVWKIKQFSAIKPDQKVSMPIICSSKHVPPFFLTISINSDNETVQIIVGKTASNEFDIFFVRCRVSVIDIDGRTHIQTEETHEFASPKTDETWSLPSFFKKKELIESKWVSLPNDVLSLRFEFAMSTDIELSQIEEYNFVTLTGETSTSINDIGTLTEDLRSFYVNATSHDITLKAKDGTVPAHKAVLAFRSPVLCAMFEHDTEEKKTCTVDIPDVDSNTLHRMIKFMYTDTVDFLCYDNVRKLYIASDKYQVITLRKKCSSFLMANLSQKNIFDILVLAHMHQDKSLITSVSDYLLEPPYDNFFSNEFENFILTNADFAYEILRAWIEKLKSEIELNF